MSKTAATSHAQALERFKLGSDAISKQVKRETDDLKFQIPEPEFQWAPEAIAMRSASTAGNIAVPAKPMLCIPKLDQPIQLVLNQEKAAHLGVQVHALSEDADDDTAEILQGLYRRIEVDSRAGLARSWAYERAVKCGRGAYRILTEPCDDYGETKDQRIVIKRILHQESVILDPFAEEPDWSDGRWAFVASWMPWDRYKAKYPDSEMAGFDDQSLADLIAERPEWITGEGAARAVLVVEYFRLEGEDTPQLKWSLMNAVEELDSEDQDGRYIPIIPVIGREMIPFAQERRWSGIISQNKDAQRLFNYSASQAVGVAALEPLAPFVLDPRQIEGYETWWQQANVKQFPYLPAQMDANKAWGPPQRVQMDAGRLGPSMMLIQQADSFIHAGTGAFESALGEASPQNKTKGGILALQQQQEQSNSHFLDNLAQISLTYEAKVVLDKMPYVYDRPGRVVRTLDLEDNTKTVMLNKPFSRDPKGRPMVAPQGPPPGMGAPPPQPGGVLNLQAPQQPPKTYHYDLKKGRYGVVVSVGKSYQNRAQQGKDELGQIFQAVPETFSILGDLYFKFADFPGHREAAERMKKMLPPPLQEQDGQNAEQEAAQLKAQLQHVTQQAGEMQKALDTEAAKHQAMLEAEHMKQSAAVSIAKMKADTEADLSMALAVMNNATKIATARITAAKASFDSIREGQEEALALDQTHAHEAVQNAMDRQHATTQTAQQHANTLQQADQGQQHALQQGDQGQQNALEQQQQAADLAPPQSGGA